MSDFAYDYFNSELDKLASCQTSMQTMWETVKNDSW